MTCSFRLVKIVAIFTVLFLFFSCEKETTPEQTGTTQTLSIKIVSETQASGTGDLVITNANGKVKTHNALQYGETQEIETDLTAEGMYTFEVEDAQLGRIKLFAFKEALSTYTSEAPFILQFEHYKNQKIAAFQVKSEIGPNLQNRRIDLEVIQSYRSLYHIDWGDGTKEIAESPDRYETNTRIEHKYASSGEYTITLRTTNGEEVDGLNLQVTGNGSGDKIQTLELENIPNLTSLSLGDSDMKSIDSIIEKYPNLIDLSLRFGSLESIDLSKNLLLEGINITGNYNTIVKGISSLTKLKGLGVTGDIENLNLALYPELLSLTVRGHEMRTLDLSVNPKLILLTLQLNDLEQINLSTNLSLKHVYITNNSLTQINLSNNKKIESLDLYANYIDELDISQQNKLKYLNLSSVHLKQVTAPDSLDDLTLLDLSNSRFLNGEDLLAAVFEGQANNPKTKGQIMFHELAYVIERQVTELNQLVTEHDWKINVPE